MAKLFGNMTTDGLEEAQDRVGRFSAKETGIYTGTVKLAYAGKAQSSDARSVTFHIELEDGHVHQETLWITTKDGKNYYPDKQDSKKKHPLPGFTVVDDICLVTTGYSLADQDFEEKVVSLYDFTAGKDVPQNVPCLTDVMGKTVLLAIVKQIVSKQKKNDAGVYVDTDETRTENVIEKVFHEETRRTVVEIRNGVEDPIFIEAWAEKNTGQTRDRTKKNAANSNQGTPGRPPVAAKGNGAPKASLFS